MMTGKGDEQSTGIDMMFFYLFSKFFKFGEKSVFLGVAFNDLEPFFGVCFANIAMTGGFLVMVAEGQNDVFCHI